LALTYRLRWFVTASVSNWARDRRRPSDDVLTKRADHLWHAWCTESVAVA
jgi:hypothetical protein